RAAASRDRRPTAPHGATAASLRPLLILRLFHLLLRLLPAREFIARGAIGFARFRPRRRLGPVLRPAAGPALLALRTLPARRALPARRVAPAAWSPALTASSARPRRRSAGAYRPVASYGLLEGCAGRLQALRGGV